MTNSDEIRQWVAENFHDVGEFRTPDVKDNISGVEVKATGNISSALTTWAENNMIVKGYRLKKMPSSSGKTSIWKLFSSNTTGEDSRKSTADGGRKSRPQSDKFVGKVLKTRDDGSFLVTGSDNEVYVVAPLNW
jgi:hypothetical protein